MSLKIQSKTDMYEYQAAAFRKLIKKSVGALFMDMGTGKTKVALELFRYRFNLGKVDNLVWFIPASIINTIINEMLKHLKISIKDIQIITGKRYKKVENNKLITVVGIEAMGMSNTIVLRSTKVINNKSMVVVDESSFIRNIRAKRTTRIRQASSVAKYKLIMTGTPVCNYGVVDLFSQIYFLSPKIMGYNSFYKFQKKHIKYSEIYPGMIEYTYDDGELVEKIAPFSFQIKKEECIELPEKQYLKYYFTMSETQRWYYEKKKEEYLELIREDEVSPLGLILKLFTELQQIISGWINEYGKTTIIKDNPRLELLLSIIENIDQKEQIIIWAKHHNDIKLIKDLIDREYGSENVSLFYGKNIKDRNKELMLFAEGKRRFFLATPSSGGFGLNELINRRYAIYYNNDFKYDIKRQSEDRIHRIGQNISPTYIDIVCEQSIDERIIYAIENKKTLEELFILSSPTPNEAHQPLMP